MLEKAVHCLGILHYGWAWNLASKMDGTSSEAKPQRPVLAYFFTAATTANSVRLFNFYRIPNGAIIHTFDNPLICGFFPEGTSCHELRMTSTPICQRPGRDTKKIGQFWIARRIVGAEPTGYFCVFFPV